MSSNPLPPAQRFAGTVGQGTGVRIAIMDEAGAMLADGDRGEVVIMGPNVMKGYRNNPRANASSFADGWFRTGDQGFLDDLGYLSITGRLKELINRGGEKIASSGGRRSPCPSIPPCRTPYASASLTKNSAKKSTPLSWSTETLRRRTSRPSGQKYLIDFKVPKTRTHSRHSSAHRHRQDTAQKRRSTV